jgi:MFS family permease
LLVGSIAFSAYLTVMWAGLAWIPSWLATLPGSPEDARQMQTIIQGVFAVMGCATGGLLTHFLGRKPSIMLGCSGLIVSSFALFLGFDRFHPSLYWVGGGFGFFHGLTQSAFYVYIPELFRTRVRMSGVGFCFNSGRLITSLAVLMVGTLVQLLGGYGESALTFSVGGAAIVLLTMLFARETRGISLKD